VRGFPEMNSLHRRARLPNLPPVSIRYLFIGAVAALLACGSEQASNPLKVALAEAPPAASGGASVVFRFPAAAGVAQLYRLPDLEQVSWRFEIGNQPTQRIVGFSGDNDLIYVLTRRSDSLAANLVALDLVTGRSRTLDSNVVTAAMGPTGTAYVVRADGSIGQAEHRRTTTWPDTIADSTEAVWGAVRGRLLALVKTDLGPELLWLANGQPTIRRRIPEGDIAVSRWGRFVAVATDSGIAMFDPVDTTGVRFAKLSPSPRLVQISPSAHRVYTVLGDDLLVSMGRLAAEVDQRVRLSGRVTDLRMDPMGRVMLARGENDAFWIIDLVSLDVVTMVQGSWGPDLPAVAPDGTILVQQDDNLSALSGAEYTAVASVGTSAGDRWLTTAWDPRRPALEFAADSAVGGVEQAGVVMYVQVSSSRNPVWAQAFADELSRAGLNASVLQPDSSEELLYRVVLGPFTTREEAEENGRRLGRAYWIFTKQTGDSTP
jgi:hypothetical protein